MLRLAQPFLGVLCHVGRVGVCGARGPVPHSYSREAAASAHDPTAIDDEVAMNERLLTSRSFEGTFVGPLSVAKLRGKGLGLVATAPVGIGGLLLVAQPLAHITGQPGSDELPDAAELPAQLLDAAAAGGAAARWLRALYRGPGSTAGATGDGGNNGRADAAGGCSALNALLNTPLPPPKPRHGGGGNAGRPDASTDASGAAPPLTLQQLADVVSYNAFGDKFDDLIAAEAAWQAADGGCESGSGSGNGSSSPVSGRTGSRSGGSGVPHVGLWPHFSFLNHSCLPNAIHYTIGRTLVVRAAQPLAAGDEVTVSYLGTEDHTPASMRRKVLHQRYGFECTCPRCQLEDQLPDRLASLLLTINGEVRERLLPAFSDAVEEPEQLQQVGEDLLSLSQELYVHLDSFVATAAARNFRAASSAACAAAGADGLDVPELGGPAHAVLCIEAAVYEFFQLMSMRDEVVGADYTASLQNCVRVRRGSVPATKIASRIMDAVCRGSELHAFLAARVLFRELRAAPARAAPPVNGSGGGGAVSDAVARAMADCRLAHVARYGRLPMPHLLQAMKLSERIGQRFM